MSASCRNRKFKLLENEQNNVRFAPQSGHYASIDLNYRFVPKAALRLNGKIGSGVAARRYLANCRHEHVVDGAGKPEYWQQQM